MKTNVATTIETHEGGRAKRISKIQELRRTVMACLLWEKQFYEDGKDIASRIASLVHSIDRTHEIALLAGEARMQLHLRHVPLLIAREMARSDKHRHAVARVLESIIQRPDELSEFLSIYWVDGKQPLSAQVKKGLAKAFTKFDEYQLAKYNRDAPVKLRDVLFLSHAKPKDKEQAETWKRLIDGTLKTPDTWETALSGGEDKKDAFTRLIREEKLGGLAMLRNLRNMIEAGVDEEIIIQGIRQANYAKVLPFRFIAAARYAPQFEDVIQEVFFASLADTRLPGKTIILVDVSGSMESALSGKSDMRRMDAAFGVAMIAREICERVQVFTFSNETVEVPNRRGFALRDAMRNSQGFGGTYLGLAVKKANSFDHDRIIAVTDEQSHDHVGDPAKKGYMINVASYKNGVGYAKWTHIDGWSDSVIRYIIESEK